MPSRPHSTTATQTLRLQWYIVSLGVVLLGIKFLAYFLTDSVAILTDALESIVNVVAGGITLYSLYLSARPRDANHPYGHGKAEFLSASIEGALILLAGIWILYEAILRLIEPAELQKIDWGLALIGITGAINFGAGYVAEKTGRKNSSPAITATGKHLKSDAWSTAGILIGLLIVKLTGLAWVDSAVALVFGGIIMYTGVKILRGSVAGIMDEADETLITRMVDLLNNNRRQNWIDLHNLRIIKYGSQLHFDCHLTIPWYLNVHEAHDELSALENLAVKEFGDSLEIFAHTDGCLPVSCPICDKNDCPVRKKPFVRKVEWTVQNIFENKKHDLES